MTFIVNQKYLRSEAGFESPGFTVDSNGNVNTLSNFLISGATVLSSSTLGSGIVSSSLTRLGTLSNLIVGGNTQISGGSTVAISATGVVAISAGSNLTFSGTTVSISSNGVGNINNMTIGVTTPAAGNFTSIIATSITANGTITVPTPTLSTQATNKQYVDSKASALAIALGA